MDKHESLNQAKNECHIPNREADPRPEILAGFSEAMVKLTADFKRVFLENEDLRRRLSVRESRSPRVTLSMDLVSILEIQRGIVLYDTFSKLHPNLAEELVALTKKHDKEGYNIKDASRQLYLHSLMVNIDKPAVFAKLMAEGPQKVD